MREHVDDAGTRVAITPFTDEVCKVARERLGITGYVDDSLGAGVGQRGKRRSCTGPRGIEEHGIVATPGPLPATGVPEQVRDLFRRVTKQFKELKEESE